MNELCHGGCIVVRELFVGGVKKVKRNEMSEMGGRMGIPGQGCSLFLLRNLAASHENARSCADRILRREAHPAVNARTDSRLCTVSFVVFGSTARLRSFEWLTQFVEFGRVGQINMPKFGRGRYSLVSIVSMERALSAKIGTDVLSRFRLQGLIFHQRAQFGRGVFACETLG